LVGEGKKVKVTYPTLQPGNGYQAETRRNEAVEALGMLGVTDYSFNDAQRPSDQEIERLLGQELKAFAPDTILLPNPVDNNDQHMQFSLCAVRVLKGLRNAPDVMLYEVWQPIAPNLIIETSTFFGVKVEALRKHQSQLRQMDFEKAVTGLDDYRAAMSGIKGKAEAFLFLDARQFCDLTLDQ
jgi:LmbE family N-acetylglucosaminyl deacetylase